MSSAADTGFPVRALFRILVKEKVKRSLIGKVYGPLIVFYSRFHVWSILNFLFLIWKKYSAGNHPEKHDKKSPNTVYKQGSNVFDRCRSSLHPKRTVVKVQHALGYFHCTILTRVHSLYYSNKKKPTQLDHTRILQISNFLREHGNPNRQQ